MTTPLNDSNRGLAPEHRGRGPWVPEISDQEIADYISHADRGSANFKWFVENLAEENRRLRVQYVAHQRLRDAVGKLLRALPIDLPPHAANLRTLVVAALNVRNAEYPSPTRAEVSDGEQP